MIPEALPRGADGGRSLCPCSGLGPRAQGKQGRGVRPGPSPAGPAAPGAGSASVARATARTPGSPARRASPGSGPGGGGDGRRGPRPSASCAVTPRPAGPPSPCPPPPSLVPLLPPPGSPRNPAIGLEGRRWEGRREVLPRLQVCGASTRAQFSPRLRSNFQLGISQLRSFRNIPPHFCFYPNFEEGDNNPWSK